jgi:hypothetical protein
MKRFVLFSLGFLACAFVPGCSSDTNDGLLTTTIQLIDLAATDVGNIKSRVKDAIADAQNNNKKLDLTAAIKATEALKERGKDAQELKRRITHMRSDVSAKDQEINAKKHKNGLNVAFSNLLKEREELKSALAEAERLDRANAKAAVKDLREKIIEAESPFEALSR